MVRNSNTLSLPPPPPPLRVQRRGLALGRVTEREQERSESDG